MTTDIEKILDSMASTLGTIDPNDIPNIDLYMDQVTTFMDTHMKTYKRTADDKVLTKTMINNYAKNDLLPSPAKKKYSKEHLILLILIYYYKNVISISDIKKLLTPIETAHFAKETHPTLLEIYDKMHKYSESMVEAAKKDIHEKLELLKSTDFVRDCEDSDILENFLMVTMLTFDITLKKQIVENIIDSMKDISEESETKKK